MRKFACDLWNKRRHWKVTEPVSRDMETTSEVIFKTLTKLKLEIRVTSHIFFRVTCVLFWCFELVLSFGDCMFLFAFVMWMWMWAGMLSSSICVAFFLMAGIRKNGNISSYTLLFDKNTLIFGWASILRHFQIWASFYS